MKLTHVYIFYVVTWCATSASMYPPKRNQSCQQNHRLETYDSDYDFDNREYYFKNDFLLFLKPKSTLNYTDHIKKRMAKRQVNSKSIEWVVRHGDRYNTLKGTQLCVDTNKKIAVIMNQTTKALITVYTNFDSDRLNCWLEQRKKHDKRSTY